MSTARARAHLVPVLGVGVLAATMLAERRVPLRAPTQREPARMLRNLAMGALSMAVVAGVEGPLVGRLAAGVERRGWGFVQRLPVSAAWRDVLAVLGMDYTMYVWHVLTHKVPVLWRFHLVHHVDGDLDSTTALRFHAADMLLSVPWRVLQVAVLGTSPRALAAWQGFFFASVVFHHSNLRLPQQVERSLARVLTTPRMHGIHHSIVPAERDSNWSSGLSVWDRLHRTFRLDAAPPGSSIGVAGYLEAGRDGLGRLLALPFRRSGGRHAASLLRTTPLSSVEGGSLQTRLRGDPG